MLWLLARHGTRNPSTKDMRELKEVLPDIRDEVMNAWEQGKGEIDNSTIEKLKQWEPYFDEKKEMSNTLI